MVRTPWNDPVPGYNLKKEERKEQVAPWRRLAALIADLLLFEFTIALPLSATITGPINAENPQVLAAGVILITTFFAYTITTQYLARATIGMLLFGYEVEDPKTIWRVIIRNVFIIPVFPIILLWVLDPLWILLRGERLSERWSGTKVVVR